MQIVNPKNIKNCAELSAWKFSVEEGCLLATRELTDRRIQVDLENVRHRSNRAKMFTTQVFAYASFRCLDAIHSRIDKLIVTKRPTAPRKRFSVHARRTFVGTFHLEWKLELVELLASIEAWASSLDVNECIAAFVRNCPDGGRVYTDGPSLSQINHLAGLAFNGNFGELEGYSAIFKRGARMNFIPLITLEIIDAVLDIAYDQFANKRTVA